MGRGQLVQKWAFSLRNSCLYPRLNRISHENGQPGGAPWMGGLRHIRQHSKQKVILTTPIERLGQAGQIVKVAPGYARNRLIPEMLALPAIEKFVLLVQNQIQATGVPQVEATQEKIVKVEVSEEEKLKEINAVLRRLAAGRVVLKRHVGMKTTLLQCVTKSDILFEVQRQLAVDLHEDNVQLETDFSTVGEFEVPLRLPEGLRLPGDSAKMFSKSVFEENKSGFL